MNQQPLTEGVHYYRDEFGNIVFTGKFLLEKGTCCGMGCLHCPYHYANVSEHLRNDLINARIKKENS
jgi:hypothetical protein